MQSSSTPPVPPRAPPSLHFGTTVTPTEDGQALVIASETGIQVGPQIQVIQRTMFVVPFANLSGFIGAIEQARSEAQGKQSRIVIPQLG